MAFILTPARQILEIHHPPSSATTVLHQAQILNGEGKNTASGGERGGGGASPNPPN